MRLPDALKAKAREEHAVFKVRPDGFGGQHRQGLTASQCFINVATL